MRSKLCVRRGVSMQTEGQFGPPNHTVQLVEGVAFDWYSPNAIWQMVMCVYVHT